jgi:two-component system sensor histidine kinase KdpD
MTAAACWGSIDSYMTTQDGLRTGHRLPRVSAGLTTRRRLAGAAAGGVLLPALTVLLVQLRSSLNLSSNILLFLLAVVSVALIGGFWPALAAALGSFLLLNYFFTPPFHTLTVDERNDVIALIAFVAVATMVSSVVDLAARRQRRLAAAALLVDADRTRTALLAAVSHDLRSPLASAKAAVTALRSRDVSWQAAARTELLATADESLDQLTRLVENLLDMSRLQAGALSVFPRPVGLDDVLPHVLDELGPAGRRVGLRIAADLPEVHADPGLLERIVANLAANALRYAPPDIPPLLSARRLGERVELRVSDRGPGVPESQWDRIFVPFQRLGDRHHSTGVGLGLALSRGLAEAMGGALTPEHTPGGGLTMVLSLPAARPGRTVPGEDDSDSDGGGGVDDPAAPARLDRA